MAKEQTNQESEETVDASMETEAQKQGETQGQSETQEQDEAQEQSESKASEEAAEGPADGQEETVCEEDTEEQPDKKDKKTQMIEELNDKMMRTMAEFENFRKRSEKEKSQMFEIGARSVIEKILPVMDNFERGLASMEETPENKAVLDGMQMIYKQLETVFDELGVTAIEAVGKEFDPNLHNAVMAVEDDSMESNTVCEELQKGYMYKETVVRHSMVKVVS